MATYLVTKRCDLGSLGVPGPASTPLGRRGRATSSIDPKLDLDLDISDLGFDQISSYKRRGCPNGPKGLLVQGPRGPNSPKGLLVQGPRGAQGPKGLSGKGPRRGPRALVFRV